MIMDLNRDKNFKFNKIKGAKMRTLSKVEISKEILKNLNTTDTAEITIRVNDLAKKGAKMETLTPKSQFFIENIIDFAKKADKEAEIAEQLENTLKELYLKLVSEY